MLFHCDVMDEINNFNCLLEELNFHILWRHENCQPDTGYTVMFHFLLIWW